MDVNSLSGIIRAVLAAIGGFILAKGYLSADTWNWIAGGVVTVVTAGWSWWSNRPAAVAAQAQKIDGVNVQVSSSAAPAVAQAVSNVKASS